MFTFDKIDRVFLLFYVRFLISISAHDQNRYPFDHSSAWRNSRNVQSLHEKSDGKRTWKFWAVTSFRTKSVPPTDGVKSSIGRSNSSSICNRKPPLKHDKKEKVVFIEKKSVSSDMEKEIIENQMKCWFNPLCNVVILSKLLTSYNKIAYTSYLEQMKIVLLFICVIWGGRCILFSSNKSIGNENYMMLISRIWMSGLIRNCFKSDIL